MPAKRVPGPIGQPKRTVSPARTTTIYSQTPQTSPIGVEALRRMSNLTASPNGSADGKQESSNGSAAAVGIGMAAVARIPVPGTNGLFLELRARGRTPAGGTTSTVFIQDITGKRVLRLDYGFNKTTAKVDYHWNQKGTFAEFGIPDHSAAGRAGVGLYEGARFFRYAGRVLLVAGLAMDLYSVVVAKRRWRQVARVSAGWAGASAGCELIGGWGAGAGTAVEPGGGTAILGLLGCAVGGVAGYAGASWAAGEIYDWVEETFFEAVPPVAGPEE